MEIKHSKPYYLLQLLYALSIVALFSISAPLGSLYLIYDALNSLFIKPRIFINLMMIFILLTLSRNFTIYSIYNLIISNGSYCMQNGIMRLFGHQLNHMTTYLSDITAIMFIPIALKTLLLKLKNRPMDHVAPVSSDGYQTFLGIDNNSSQVSILDSELNQHCLVLGTTGSGKTTTLLNFVNTFARNCHPVIYMDGKGSTELITKLSTIAKQHNRILKVFSLNPNLACSTYNPFASGSATSWRNRIMSLFASVQNKGQEHFSIIEQNYLNFVTKVLYSPMTEIDLYDLLSFLQNPTQLINLAHKIDPEIEYRLMQLHNDKNIKNNISDVIRLLELFVYSDYGNLFKTKNSESVIRIKQSILNNEMVLFLFDASTYPDDTNKIAKMVINDINSSFAEFGAFTKCLCVFDEFASYASNNLSDTLSLHRSNGMHALVGTQSIATTRTKNPGSYHTTQELLANCNTYIIHRINHDDDAKVIANLIGTSSSYLPSIQNTRSNNTSYQKHNSYIIEPQEIKTLTTGNAIIYRKTQSPIILHRNTRITNVL